MCMCVSCWMQASFKQEYFDRAVHGDYAWQWVEWKGEEHGGVSVVIRDRLFAYFHPQPFVDIMSGMGAGNTDSICIGTGVEDRPKPNDFICCETQSPVGSFLQDEWMMETTYVGVQGCML